MKQYKMKSENDLIKKNRDNVDAGLDMPPPAPKGEMKLKNLDKPGTFDTSPDGARGDVPWGGQKSMVSPKPANVNIPMPPTIPPQLYDPAPGMVAPVVTPVATPHIVGQGNPVMNFFDANPAAMPPREQIMGLPDSLANIPMAPMSLVRNARKRRSVGI